MILGSLRFSPDLAGISPKYTSFHYSHWQDA
jgi:hypothetical protein